MDVEKTTRLMNIGGISELTVVNSEGTERVVPQIVGYDKEGGAYASLAKSRTINISNITTEDTEQRGSKSLQWRSMHLEINTQEIADQISQKKDGTLHSSRLWAVSLNKEIKEAVRKQGVAHSLKFSNNYWEYVYDLSSLLNMGSFITSALAEDYVHTATSAGLLLLIQFRKLMGISDPNWRSDIFYSSHVGRAFWTNFRANTSYRNLVVAMEKDREV